jgi:hypothetical protein
MHATYLVILGLLCLVLFSGCADSTSQAPSATHAEESHAPGILHDQFEALDKAKALQQELQKKQAAQERQFEDRSN